ncbi:hypothetical protein MLD38_039232 [Melastoma candidum]|uniref:Uncharacterized protein n=1 Tax=Melastoma candidum TaxID=119954 RepID=A0ACB9L279_9MYRT|nr:hypothetical protein MLD38_039232 [Melastoma candidum]
MTAAYSVQMERDIAFFAELTGAYTWKASRQNKNVFASNYIPLWLEPIYSVLKRTGEMHEKYDVANPGEFGGGGEYVPQVGNRNVFTISEFVWLNGVVLSFLEEFGWPVDRNMDLC